MAGSGIIEKNDDPWRSDYRYRGLDPQHVLEAMGKVFEFALEHSYFRVTQANWLRLTEKNAFVFRIITEDDNIAQGFDFTITEEALHSKDAILMMMDSFRKSIIDWWEIRHKMIARLLGKRQNDMCEFYPKKHENCGVCHAGSDVSGSTIHFPLEPGPEWKQWTCSKEYSKTCQWAIKERMRPF